MDGHEAADLEEIVAWVTSGEPLYRVASPATPPRHLVVYIALLDEAARSLLLVDQVKAGCWLLPGGHVEPDEDPACAVVREAREELGVDVVFNDRLGGQDGFFVTQTQTRGAGTHTDVTVWFVVEGDHRMRVVPDPGEFRGTGWYSLDEPIRWESDSFDPQMHRFIAKVRHATVAAVDLTESPVESTY